MARKTMMPKILLLHHEPQKPKIERGEGDRSRDHHLNILTLDWPQNIFLIKSQFIFFCTRQLTCSNIFSFMKTFRELTVIIKSVHLRHSKIFR